MCGPAPELVLLLAKLALLLGLVSEIHLWKDYSSSESMQVSGFMFPTL